MAYWCFFILAVMLGIYPTTEAGYSSYNTGLNLQELDALLTAMENEKKELFEDLASIKTICSTAEDNLDSLENNVERFIEINNRAQGKDITRLYAQAKALQHRVDAAEGTAAETLKVTQDTATTVQDQLDDIDGSKLAGANANQQMRIDQLTSDVAAAKEDFLQTLSSVTQDLTDISLRETVSLNLLFIFISSRKCEYGFGSFGPGLNDVVFKTNFGPFVPTVSLQQVGFSSHLDAEARTYHDHRKHVMNVLAAEKVVEYTNTTGFGVRVGNGSQGSVLLKSVYCSWSACRFIDQEFNRN